MTHNDYQMIAVDLVDAYRGYAIGYNPHKYDAPYVVYSVYVKDCRYCYFRPTEYLREVDARIAYYNCLMDDWADRQCSLTKMG